MSGSVFATSDPNVRMRPEQDSLCSYFPHPQVSKSHAVGKNMNLKANRLDYIPGSTQSVCDLGQVAYLSVSFFVCKMGQLHCPLPKLTRRLNKMVLSKVILCCSLLIFPKPLREVRCL